MQKQLEIVFKYILHFIPHSLRHNLTYLHCLTVRASPPLTAAPSRTPPCVVHFNMCAEGSLAVVNIPMATSMNSDGTRERDRCRERKRKRAGVLGGGVGYKHPLSIERLHIIAHLPLTLFVSPTHSLCISHSLSGYAVYIEFDVRVYCFTSCTRLQLWKSQ